MLNTAIKTAHHQENVTYSSVLLPNASKYVLTVLWSVPKKLTTVNKFVWVVLATLNVKQGIAEARVAM
jgi:hypothetical protein